LRFWATCGIKARAGKIPVFSTNANPIFYKSILLPRKSILVPRAFSSFSENRRLWETLKFQMNRLAVGNNNRDAI
jgi:hypothetical protein